MAKRERRTDNTMAKRERTNNTMAKRERRPLCCLFFFLF
jgi:hypothetical protein